MEKFEMDSEKKLEIFNIFVGKAKDAFGNLLDEIKTNIKNMRLQSRILQRKSLQLKTQKIDANTRLLKWKVKSKR